MARSDKKGKGRGWIQIAIWALSVFIVLGVSGLFVVNYALDRFIASIADQMVVDLEAPEDRTDPLQEVADTTTTVPDEPAEPGKEESEPSEPVLPDNGGEEVQEPSVAEEPESAKPEKNQAGDITVEQAKQIQKDITAGDKTQVTTILLKRLSLSDLKRLKELAGGGVTAEEKKEAKELILEKMTPEEYNELSQIAKKYGASQGKTYDEARKEENNS